MSRAYPERHLGIVKGDIDRPAIETLLEERTPAGRHESFYVARVDALGRIEARLSPMFDIQHQALGVLADIRRRTEPKAVLVIETTMRFLRRVRA